MVDRFIPYRCKKHMETASFLIKEDLRKSHMDKCWSSTTSRYMNPARQRLRKEKYQLILRRTAGLCNNKILNISGMSHFNFKEVQDINTFTWPIYARKEPLIGAPDTILSVQNLNVTFGQQVTDWGQELLAFICKEEICLWQSNTKTSYAISDKKVGDCIRWSKSGKMLAVGLNNGFFSVLDGAKQIYMLHASCTCNNTCSVTSIEWASNGYLISGCTNGILCIWSGSLELINCQNPAHQGGIIRILMSCNERYLASTGMDTKVKIWFWPSMFPNFQIECFSVIKALAWHPWKESLFAIAGSELDGTITFWSATSQQLVAKKTAAASNIFVDEITWNCLTGELVVSYCEADLEDPLKVGKISISVLSNLFTEVDRIEWHTESVMYLLWGNNGRQLGTTGNDKKFCIWDFLGTCKEREKRMKLYNRRTENTEDVTHIFSSSARFRQTIR